MTIFKKNIWLLFYMLLLLGMIYSVIWVIIIYSNVQKDFRDRQNNQVKLVASSLNSLLLHQEMLLDIVGNTFMTTCNNKIKLTRSPILQEMFAINPAIAVYGVLDPKGNFRFASHNLKKDLLPNIKEQKESRSTFVYALSKNKMILGRTYYFKPIKQWVIPIRKSIRNNKGQVIAVMTAGLNLAGASQFYSNRLHMGANDRIDIIREFDYYIQYRSSNNYQPEIHYNMPVSKSHFKKILLLIKKKYKKSINHIKMSNKIYSATYKDQNNTPYIYTIKYNQRYELWIVSALRHQAVLNAFIPRAGTFIGIYVLLSAIIYFLFRYIDTAEKKKEAALRHQTNHDYLTSLPNRNYLDTMTNHWFKEDAPPFTIYYIDSDNFKYINDSFGHQLGDQVLLQLTKRLKSTVSKKSLIIRTGGDEFLIMTPEPQEKKQLENDIDQENKLLNKALKLISLLSKPYIVDNYQLSLGACIGIARFPEHGKDVSSLLRAVDIAMSEAKKERNTAKLFSKKLEEAYLQNITIQHELPSAISGREIYLVYQPQVDIRNNVIGVEALVRWKSPKLGFVSPQELITCAESSGLIKQLGDYIINTALKEAKEIQEKTNTTFMVSINISVKQFMMKNFADYLYKKITESGLNSSFVTIEITESLFIEDITYLIPILNQIHEKKIKIALDDFGTGYSSLNVLKSLPIDELKIDKSFIDNIVDDTSSLQMVKNIIAIAKNFNMYIVAEGVETPEQNKLLHELGCKHIQGYLYSKPLNKNDLVKHLTQKNSH